MKKYFWLSLIFLGFSFFLSGLQGSLYFFPIPLPAFWFIILTYYSFRKKLAFSLLLNIPHALIIAAFATVSVAKFIFLMNIVTIAFYFIRERFHTSQWHITLAAGGGVFLFLVTTWLADLGLHNLSWPPFLPWIGLSLSTLLFSPPLVLFLDRLDQRIEYDRVDMLENLRV